MKRLFLLICLSLPFTNLFAQTGCPEVEAGENITLDCDSGNTAELSATFLDIGETDRYEVEAIEFDPPFAFNEGTPADINADDTWSSVIDLPFDFCFFEDSNSQLLVGANGQVTFDLTQAGTGCPWTLEGANNTPLTIPENSVAVVDAIFGAFHDMDITIDNEGSFSYGVLGEAPCRAFVVNYNNIPHYSNTGNCDNISTSQQIVMYENTNTIDVYLRNKPVCAEFNGGFALVGIINDSGNIAYTPPERNTSVWSVEEEAWRFIPRGDPITTFSWLDEEGNVISNDPDFTVSPTETTTYTAEVIYALCDGEELVARDDVTVTVDNGDINIEQPEDMVVCDEEPLDGEAVFNLSTQDDVINNTSDPNLVITYHTTSTDAGSGANPISNPDSYTNATNPQTIFASVLNSTNDCRQTVQFDLIVNQPAEFNTIPPQQICDTDGDGTAEFDLDALIDDIRTNTTDVVTFHATQQDAIDGVDALTSPHTNTSNPQTIFVRIDNGTGCFATEPYSFEISVGEQPSVNTGGELQLCSDSATADFTLTDLDSQVTSDTGVTITYHASQADAEANDNPLSSPFNSPTATIWVRVENADGCFAVVSAELIVNTTPTIELDDLTECEESPNTATFDLDAYLADLQATYPGIDFSIHATQTDAENGIDPMTGVFTTNPVTLWVAYSDPAAPECGGEDSFDLIVQAEPGFNTIADQELCDEDGDGIASFNLNDLIPMIQANSTDVITFHATELDAIDGVGVLTSPYENTSNPQTIFVMIESASGCRLTTPYSFELIVLEQPDVITGASLELCAGGDTATFNLALLDDQVTAEVGAIITYHATQADAEADANALPTSFTTMSTTVWVRVENSVGCFDVVSAELIVTNSPNIELENIEECEESPNTATFNLDQYLADLMVTYPSLDLSIHATEMDADNGTAELSGNFTNTSNPQTLWVAVVDPAAPECNDSFPFDLIVNGLPTIQAGPFSLAACDINENGTGMFTLSDADTQITTTGDVVTYHASQADAEAGTNPLPNNFDSAPTTVFTRVENADGCFVTTTVELIVNPIPVANNVANQICSQISNGDFDLDALIDEITGSAVDVTTTFHATLADAQQGNSNLSSPFNTTSTTVFARVENDNTGCFNVAEVELEVIVAPDTTIENFDSCDEGDSTANFDLEVLRNMIETDTGGTVTLHDSQAAAEDGNTGILAGTINSVATTIWVKIATDLVDCEGVRPVDLIVNPLPPTTTFTLQNCRLATNPNQFTFLTSTLDQSFTYSVHESIADAEADNARVSFPFTTLGDFTELYVRNENPATGCFSISNLELLVTDFITNELEPTPVCYGESFTLPDGRVITEEGQYVYQNVENCTNDVYTLDFQVCNPEEYCRPLMPTAFSPNGSGMNDFYELLVPTGCTLEIEFIQIYNRWGEVVYESVGNDFTWDGFFNSSQAQQGVYLWEIAYSYTDDQGNQGASERGGSVFLLR